MDEAKIECLASYLQTLSWNDTADTFTKAYGSDKAFSFSERISSSEEILRCQKEEARRSSFTIPFQEVEYSQLNKDTLPPVRVAFSEKYGRFLEATRTIIPGDILFRETPLVLAPRGGSGPTCLDCFKPLSRSNWSVCPKCSAPRCISGSCHETYHSENECDILAKIFSRNKNKEHDEQWIKILNVILTPLRTWIVTNDHPHLEKIVEALQSNAAIRKNTPIGKFIEHHVVSFLQNETDLNISSDYVHHVCGVFDTNAFEIYHIENRESRGLLPVASLMNHSCTPNTQHWFTGNQCVVRASMFIREGDPITNSYTQSLWGTSSRLQHLLLTKHFLCKCSRCRDPTELGTYLSSVICKNCDGAGLHMPPISSSKGWICNVCSNEIESASLQNILTVTSGILSQSNNMEASLLWNTIKKLSKMLGRQHYTTVELQFLYVKLLAGNCSEASTAELVQGLSTISFLMDIANKLEPGVTQMRGLLLLRRMQIICELFKKIDRDKENKYSSFEMLSMLQNSDADAAEAEAIFMVDPHLMEVRLLRQQLSTYLEKQDGL